MHHVHGFMQHLQQSAALCFALLCLSPFSVHATYDMKLHERDGRVCIKMPTSFNKSVNLSHEIPTCTGYTEGMESTGQISTEKPLLS